MRLPIDNRKVETGELASSGCRGHDMALRAYTLTFDNNGRTVLSSV
jgi:hypothetical protein